MLQGGLVAEMAPTDHAGIMRFTFPSGQATGSLVFDNGTFTIGPGNTMTGWVDNGSGLSAGRSRMFVSATFDRAPTATTATAATFDTSSNSQVTAADRDVVPVRRPGHAQPRSRGIRAILRRRPQCRARRVERPARADRRAGRERHAEDDAVLEPVPDEPLSELAVGEHRHGGRTALAVRQPGVRPGWHVDRHAHRREDRRRPDLRQQRILGHIPHGMAGVLAAVPRCRGAHCRRFRAAVPRRRLDRALVVTRLRRPDDRHERRRGDGRDLPERRATARRAERVQRGNPRRHRCIRPERGRPQGHRDRAVPRLHADQHGRIGVVGARGLHQRLRHREPRRDAGQGQPLLVGPAQPVPRGVRVLPAARPELRQPVRPVDEVLRGTRRGGQLRRAGPHRVGRRVHRDRRVELRVHRAAGRPGSGQPLRRPKGVAGQARSVLRDARRTPTSPAPTAASSTRCARRRPSGWGSWA